MKAESLLDKAKASSHGRKSRHSEDDLLALVIGALRGEVRQGQCAAALGSVQSAVYSTLFARLRRAVEAGEVTITVNNGKPAKGTA